MFHEEWDKNALCAAFIEDTPDVVKEIRDEGAADKAREMAKALKANGVDIGIIANSSGLTEEEIKAL